MSEVPSFHEDIDPDILIYLDELSQQMDRRLKPIDLPPSRLESCRSSYLGVIAKRRQAISSYLIDRAKPSRAFSLGMQDDIANSHFLYYLKAIMENTEPNEKHMLIVEAFYEADGSQSEFNIIETGQSYIYDTQELQARVAEILLADDDKKIEQDFVDMYEHNFSGCVQRFISGRERSI